MKAMVNSAFGDGKSGIVPPPTLPHISPLQFAPTPKNGGNGGMTDYIDGIAIPSQSNLGPADRPVINEGGSGAV